MRFTACAAYYITGRDLHGQKLTNVDPIHGPADKL